MTSIGTGAMRPDGNAYPRTQNREAGETHTAPHSNDRPPDDATGQPASHGAGESRPDGYQYASSQQALQEHTDQAYRKYVAAKHRLDAESAMPDDQLAEAETTTDTAKAALYQAVSTEIRGKIQDAYGHGTTYSTRDLIASFGKSIQERIGDGEVVRAAVAAAAADHEPGDYEQADQIVAGIHGSSVEQRVAALASGLQGTSQQTKSLVLENDSVQALLKEAAEHAASPARRVLGEPDLSSASLPMLLQAANLLTGLTKDLPPEFVATILDGEPKLIQALTIGSTLAADPHRESSRIYAALSNAYAALGGGSRTSDARRTLAGALLSHLRTQDENDLNRRHTLESIIGGTIGGFGDTDPALSLALGQQDPQMKTIVTQAFQSRARVLTSQVDAHLQFTEELDWLVSTYGSVMTEQQLEQAIDEYRTSKGPEWNARFEEDRESIAAMGRYVMGDLAMLEATGGHEDTMKALLDDPKNMYAIRLNFQKHPEQVDQGTLEVLANAEAMFPNAVKTGDNVRKLGVELANVYIREKVLPQALGIDPGDAASVSRGREALKSMTHGPLAKWLGISPSQQKSLNAAIDELTKPVPGKHSVDRMERVEEEMKNRLRNYDKTLLSQGFKPDNLAGSVLRIAGMAASGVSIQYNLQKAQEADGITAALHWIKAGSDAVGLSQKTADLLVKTGVYGNAILERVGMSVVERLGNVLSAGLDFAFMLTNLIDGDGPRTAAYATAAAGSTAFAMSSFGYGGAWLGPAGIAASILSGVMLGAVLSSEETTKFETEESKAFLEKAGFDSNASHTLSNQSGDGNSAVPMLTRYAELKGYDLAEAEDRQSFIHWLNDMPPDVLVRLHYQLCLASDSMDGDVTRLDGNPDRQIRKQSHHTSMGEFDGRKLPPASVGEIDAYLEEFGTTGLATMDHGQWTPMQFE